jgi:hypothetical protein
MSDPDPHSSDTVRFRVHAAYDPGTIPRVVEPFAKLALVPERLVCRRQGATLAIDLAIAGLDDARAAQLARTLAVIVGVERVAMDLAAADGRRARA